MKEEAKKELTARVDDAISIAANNGLNDNEIRHEIAKILLLKLNWCGISRLVEVEVNERVKRNVTLAITGKG